MRAYIKLWNKEFLVEAIGWSPFDERISHVSFMDDSGSYSTVYDESFWVEEGELTADLETLVYWKEK